MPSLRSGVKVLPEYIKGTVTTRRASKPPPVDDAAKERHSAKVMSARQEKRIRSGNNEGSPADYQQPSDEQRRLGEARRRLEDLRVARELGIDGGA